MSTHAPATEKEMTVAIPDPRDVVTFRARLRSRAYGVYVGAGVTVLLLLGAAVSAVADNGTADLGRAIWPPAITVLLLGAMLLAFPRMTGRPHTWDLRRGTITFNRRTYAFSEITRVVRVDGARGWRGLLFCTAEGRIRGMAVNIDGGMRQLMDREHWVAVRALLACPHQPSFESRRIMVGPGDIDKRAPLGWLRGPGAVDLVDAQIRFLDHVGSSMSRSAPVEQFHRSARRDARLRR